GCVDRNDRYGARMLNDLAVGLAPVREPDGIVEDAYQSPFVDRSPADRRLVQMRIEVEAHNASLPEARLTGQSPSASGARPLVGLPVGQHLGRDVGLVGRV